MERLSKFFNVNEFPFRLYDENGNEKYFENSVGSWSKREYDQNGNKAYYENSQGFWYKREYDKDGNKIYFEDSTGFWYKREYDKNGNEVYYETSYATIIDNRPKSTLHGKVAEIDGKKYRLEEVK